MRSPRNEVVPRTVARGSLAAFVAVAFVLIFSSSPSFALESGCSQKFKPFLERATAVMKDSPLSVEEQNAASINIDDWLSTCKFKRIGEFLDRLSDGGILEIAKTAAYSRLVSSEEIPVAEDPALYGQGTLLALPFDGVWHVVQGNRGLVSHIKGDDEEYAWDFVIMKQGRQAEGSPSENANHYCWGQPVLAPAPGVVARVVDNLEDHPPMTPNPPRKGNHILIDHGNGELSLLYHLRQGSALVKPGDTVSRGTPVGLCGDTGISMFPHLHFVVYKGTAEKHEKMETRFFGYFTVKESSAPGGRTEFKLRLSGVPKRTEYVMNAADILKIAPEESKAP